MLLPALRGSERSGTGPKSAKTCSEEQLFGGQDLYLTACLNLLNRESSH